MEVWYQTPLRFTNTTYVSVDKMSNLGMVYVVRGETYVPMLNLPELTDSSTLTFYFNKPETGFII